MAHDARLRDAVKTESGGLVGSGGGRRSGTGERVPGNNGSRAAASDIQDPGKRRSNRTGTLPNGLVNV